MNTIEEQVATTLRQHAEGEVDTAVLLASTSARGRQLKRRRSAGTAVVAVAAVAVTVGVGTAVAGQLPLRDPVGTPPATSVATPPEAPGVPAPPPMTGVPSAVRDPGTVGSPDRFHISFDEVPIEVGTVTYMSPVPSADGGFDPVEMAALTPDRKLAAPEAVRDQEPLPGARVFLSNKDHRYGGATGETSQVRVGDKPATMTRHKDAVNLRWQPADGLWLELEGQGGVDELLGVAEAVRVDRTYQCRVPFTLAKVPGGMTRTSCEMTLPVNSKLPPTGRIMLGAGDSFAIVGMDGDAVANEVPENVTVGGRPGIWHSGPKFGTTIGMLSIDDFDGHAVSVVVSLNAYTKEDAIAIAEGLRLAERLDDPASWPADPLR